ncbi:lysozyme C, milk isozyme-like [Sceloporus undulatus]|uniref:lysozyme C, milk isozyme-like n=1 Tax=Sceloporus undulatus TaxID=8520 RepID=UPI001C4C9133|nr:lysozyme C, milk isozyme-like [Sceloporus undulatus]
MMKTLCSLVLLACILATGQAEYLSQCDVAQQLQQLGLDGYAGYSLANWVCMAYHESSFNTDAINYDSNGSADFGIFQINSRYWCQNGDEYSSNICGIQCSQLLTNNIAVDVACAKTIVTDSWNGMGAWVAWSTYCQGQDLSGYIAGCNL